MFVILEFKNFEDLLNHLREIESIFKQSKSFAIKWEISFKPDSYILETKIHNICQN